MGLSEKTVELNVSRVVIEKCRRTHQRPAYSMELTQDQEATIGADIFIETIVGWTGGFIQYKAMDLQASGAFRWNLNRTTHKDQHSLLCILEDAGFPVFYCLPMFDDAATVSAWSPPSLWKQVTWVRPNAIDVPLPIDKHHHIKFVPGSPSVWSVHSKAPQVIPSDAIVPYEMVESELLKSPIKGALSLLLNTILAPQNLRKTKRHITTEMLAGHLLKNRSRFNSVTRGLSLLAFGPRKNG